MLTGRRSPGGVWYPPETLAVGAAVPGSCCRDSRLPFPWNQEIEAC